MDQQGKIDQLQRRIDQLTQRHEQFSVEIGRLRDEIESLKNQSDTDIKTIPMSEKAISAIPAESPRSLSSKTNIQGEATQSGPDVLTDKTSRKYLLDADLEKFIGENLINKIGIIITVIGVGIGAKYAIDNQMISPLTRVILGYFTGIALLVFSIRLYKEYLNFSAVLLSGSMAIFYFITFAAYDFYELIPQALTFLLMVLFTAFTVTAALKYNRSVIAHIGLVGAYGVPILLSDGSGRVEVLFSYMSLINIGVLIIALKKQWRSLYYMAFTLSWLMFIGWFAVQYIPDDHFALTLIFSTIFFLIFYTMLMAGKVFSNESLRTRDVVLVITNSLVYYAIGYAVLWQHESGKEFVGVFTLGNALIHFAAALIIQRRKFQDKSLFYFISGMVLLFVTMAIPVQLDGSWVTVLWTGEALLLFWVGRSKGIPMYEKLAYPTMILAFVSLCHDWSTGYGNYHPELPESRVSLFLNIHFLTSLLFLGAFGFINKINKSHNVNIFADKSLGSYARQLPAVFLVISAYFAFYLELNNYWNQLYAESLVIIDKGALQGERIFYDRDLLEYKKIWIILYSLTFSALLSIINVIKIKGPKLAQITLAMLGFSLLCYLMFGLLAISELRESYLDQSLATYYDHGIFNLIIRYISYLFVCIVLITMHRNMWFVSKGLKNYFDFILFISVLWIASSELIHWLDIAGSSNSYKLGVSILWGVYSLFMITLGIWKVKKHLRFGGIALFGGTLIKLIFYDLAHLDTIGKTIVFVSLGALMLIISFLYNKYKNKIADESGV